MQLVRCAQGERFVAPVVQVAGGLCGHCVTTGSRRKASAGMWGADHGYSSHFPPVTSETNSGYMAI